LPFGPAIQASPLDSIEGPTLACCSGRAATRRNNCLQRPPLPASNVPARRHCFRHE
jgi:hypothetical protein